MPSGLQAAAPWAFLLFAVAFAVYRLALVSARRYPAFKAFFQIGATVLFFTLLLPRAQAPYAPRGELEALLANADPRVRALAAEVARYRPDGRQYGQALARALEDPDPEVRRQAHLSLVELTGKDLGSPDSPNAVRIWRERYP